MVLRVLRLVLAPYAQCSIRQSVSSIYSADSSLSTTIVRRSLFQFPDELRKIYRNKYSDYCNEHSINKKGYEATPLREVRLYVCVYKLLYSIVPRKCSDQSKPACRQCEHLFENHNRNLWICLLFHCHAGIIRVLCGNCKDCC